MTDEAMARARMRGSAPLGWEARLGVRLLEVEAARAVGGKAA
jgi:hypothetical protein